jgi:Holliday junction resolvase
MKEKGYHTERVAASGRRQYSVCDAVIYSLKKIVFLVEVKSTTEKLFKKNDWASWIIEKLPEFNIFLFLQFTSM